MNIRSNAHLISDLLYYAVQAEWSDRRNTSCSCHPEYSNCCPDEEYLLYNDYGFYKEYQRLDYSYYSSNETEYKTEISWCDSWPAIKCIKAEYLGEADLSIKRGIVHSSYISY